MSKKRITVVVIVLFLLIGLTVFTFANKSEDEKLDSNKENKTEIKKEEEKEDEVITEVEPLTYVEDNTKKNDDKVTYVNSNTKEVVADVIKTVTEVLTGEEDDTYLKALTAVISAENTVDSNSYDAAKNLVEKVSNNSKKTDLAQRLEEVRKALNVKELVDNLEEMINNAAIKEDIDSARSFIEDNKLGTKVEELTLKETKEELQARLNDIIKVLNDTKAPIFNIKNNEIFNTDVVVKVIDEDENSFNLILSKDGSEGFDFANEDTVTEEGVYTLKAIDKAYNESIVKFIIDKTAPIANNSLSTTNKTNKDVVVTLSTSEEINTPDGWVMVDNTTFTKVYTKNVDEILTISDLAGNTTDVRIIVNNIDKEVPSFIGVEDNHYYNKDVTYEVTSNDTTDKDFAIKEDNLESVEVDNNSYKKENVPLTITEEGTHTIKVKDEAGNESVTLTFTIDKTLPSATTSQSTTSLTSRLVTLTASESIITPEGWTKVNDTTFTKNYSLIETGWHDVKITDLAGNSSDISFRVSLF